MAIDKQQFSISAFVYTQLTNNCITTYTNGSHTKTPTKQLYLTATATSLPRPSSSLPLFRTDANVIALLYHHSIIAIIWHQELNCQYDHSFGGSGSILSPRWDLLVALNF